MMDTNPQINQAMKATQTFACLECGKCTANCPIARYNGGYSPRRLLGQALTGSHDSLLADASLWACLACGMCETRCPADVNFSDLLQRVRAAALPTRKSQPVCTHGGALQSMMRIMTTPELHQNRLEWLTDDLEVADAGDVLLFVGCLPYFNEFFKDLGVDMLRIARSAIKIFNRVGIAPVLLKNERCCGHDLLWMGDESNYGKLAEHNMAAIKATGAKTIVTTCAECYRTLNLDYPKRFGKQAWNVQHLSEFIAEKVASGELSFADKNKVVTYQDPCRLGRQSGVYGEPRKVLEAIPQLRFVEMEKNRERALCCGTNAWINCDLTSKKIQTARLTSAKATGADTLVTCCPKCYIHFKCALQDKSLAEKGGVEIQDLSVLAAEAMSEVHHDRQGTS